MNNTNPFEDFARRIKAKKLVQVLRRAQAESTGTLPSAWLNSINWSAVAKLAGVNEPSAETIAIARKMLGADYARSCKARRAA